MTKQKKQQYTEQATKVIVALVVLVVIYYSAKTVRRSILKSSFDNNPDRPQVKLAQQYRAAINPWGYDWMQGVDGTDEDEVLRLAPLTIGLLKDVQEAYQAKYNSSLTDDLRKELSSALYNEWLMLVTAS